MVLLLRMDVHASSQKLQSNGVLTKRCIRSPEPFHYDGTPILVSTVHTDILADIIATNGSHLIADPLVHHAQVEHHDSTIRIVSHMLEPASGVFQVPGGLL